MKIESKWETKIMESKVLQYHSVLSLNREVFLLNYSKEFTLFENTDMKLFGIGEFLSKNRDTNQKSHISLIPFILIIGRQANNTFNLLSYFQSYDAWVLFRPALESLLIMGKLMDNPTLSDIWMRRKEIWRNRTVNREEYDLYKSEFESDGLIPKSLTQGYQFRRLLTKLNDEYMHMNFEHYLPRNLEQKEMDENSIFLNLHSTDTDFEEHKSYLYSFLYLFRTIVKSLEDAISKRFGCKSIVNAELESVDKIWKPKILKIIDNRPELREIFKSFGLCGFLEDN